jgi:hypothetical protein
VGRIATVTISRSSTARVKVPISRRTNNQAEIVRRNIISPQRIGQLFQSFATCFRLGPSRGGCRPWFAAGPPRVARLERVGPLLGPTKTATMVLGLRCSWCPGSAPMPKLIGLYALPPAKRQGSVSDRRPLVRNNAAVNWRGCGRSRWQLAEKVITMPALA